MKTDSFGKFFLTILFLENCRVSCQFSARRLVKETFVNESLLDCKNSRETYKGSLINCWSSRYHLFITGEGRGLM